MRTKIENIPEDLKHLNQWVGCSNESKIPQQFDGTPARVNDVGTFNTFEKMASSNHDYLGFVFCNDNIVGIDIDTGFDETGLFPSVEALDIISHCNSYTERSKSGRGFHILVRGKLPFDGQNNRAGIEIYQSNRYFVMTGDLVHGNQIIENQSAIDYIVSKYFSNSLKKNDKGDYERNVIYTNGWNKLKGNKISLHPNYEPIGQGSRNISLASLAGQLHTLGWDKDSILNELEYCNNIACSPPLPYRELKLIVKSITRYMR